MGGADKRKADLSDSDDDFAPSAEASPEVKPKPKKKSKPKAAETTKPKPELADDDDGTQASPKDKKKKEAALDYGVDITTYDQSPELTAKYSAMSVTELNQWLKANRVVKGAANKANMVARCVDGELFGAFPPCPRCVTGKLKVTYASLDAHGGQGEWTCRGAFDEAIGMRVKCYFTARPGEVTRLQWRDMHDPAPEPEKPGGGGAGTTTTDDAKFPDGFETFIPKDAANAVKAIALAMGFQLPAEGANSEIGEFLFIFWQFFGNFWQWFVWAIRLTSCFVYRLAARHLQRRRRKMGWARDVESVARKVPAADQRGGRRRAPRDAPRQQRAGVVPGRARAAGDEAQGGGRV